MRRPRRDPHRELVGIDFGSSRTRIWPSAPGIRIEKPSAIHLEVLERRSRGHRRSTAEPADTLPGSIGRTLVWPIRSGMVTDAEAAAQMLRLLLYSAAPGRRGPRVIAVGLPVKATAREQETVKNTVAGVARGRVILVEAPLAAAIGSGVDVRTGPPRLVVDIGASITEVALVGQGRVVEARLLRFGAPAYDPDQTANTAGTLPASRTQALKRLAVAVDELFDGMVARERAITRTRGLLLTGGGALYPGLPAHISAATGVSVTAPTDPAQATITGLVRCLRPDLPTAGQEHPPLHTSPSDF